jgi:hypothetical protein
LSYVVRSVVAPFAGMADKEKKKEGGLKSRIQVLF